MPGILANNPADADSREEIRELLRKDGHDPMDVRKNSQITEAWAILNAWEDEPPDKRGGRTDRQVALEAELVADAAVERGIDLEDPVDPGIDPEWYDADEY